MYRKKPYHPDYDPRAEPLVEAAGEGDLNEVRNLVLAGLPVNAIGDKHTGYYPLHAASKNGRAGVVEYLLSKGARTESRTIGISDRFAFTPLILAAQGNHLAVVKILVEAGADVNAHSLINNTPLGWAIQKRNRQMFDYLFSKGARAEVADFNLAVRVDDIERVKWFLDHGFKLDREECEFDGSHLSTAISMGPYERIGMVKFLVDHGADLSRPSSPSAEPPLVQASRLGKRKIANYLLHKGADPNVGSALNAYALTYAVRLGDLSIAELLLRKGARTDLVDFKKMRPIEWAVANKNKEMFLLLVQYGAAVSKKLVPTIRRRFGKEALVGAKIT